MLQYKRFINRELSWLKFNFRVLEQSRRKSLPLLERLKFLSIAASNLDEFFEIRVSSLEQKLAAQNIVEDNSGLTPRKALKRIYKSVNYLVNKLYYSWNHEILTSLAKEDIFIFNYEELSEAQKEYVDKLYLEEIHPVLTPIKIDTAHPFPWIINKALCIGITFESEEENEIQLGIVTIPRILPRIIQIPPGTARESGFILVSEVVRGNINELFKGYKVKAHAAFRITRNSNLYLNEEEASDLLEAIQTELHNRKKGDVVRLEIKNNASTELIGHLSSIFNLKKEQVHIINGPVNFHRVMSLYNMIERQDLKYKPFFPKEPSWMQTSENIFQKIKENDILLHHPYDSFQPVIHFLQKASQDTNVLAIKMTLYRTASDSPLMHALIDAAQNGKEVTVIVELKARFDEASNVAWAKNLLDKGVHVVYGLLGFKTHCKLILILRRENKKIAKYAHTGTGNYNEKTASIYTDLSLFTSQTKIVKEVIEIFNFLTSQSKEPKFKELLVAPHNMLNNFLKMIKAEAKAAKEGKEALIIFKVNGLQEPAIIEALYTASEAGVKIYGIVRGICCLKSGTKPYSENIYIRSIVGRFLEHSRIFYFENSKPQIYIGSADWMPRNLRRRVEVITPIFDKKITDRIRSEMLKSFLEDNIDSRILDKNYLIKKAKTNKQSTKASRSVKNFSAQEFFMALGNLQSKRIG